MPDGSPLRTDEALAPGDLDELLDALNSGTSSSDKARSFALFIGPLVNMAEDDETLEALILFGMAAWNIALFREETLRQEMLDFLLSSMAGNDPEDQNAIHALALEMITRHRALFPALHQTQQAGPDADPGGALAYLGDARALVRELLGVTSRLPRRIHHLIIALGLRAVPHLVELVNEEIARETYQERTAAAYAILLLGELRATEAIEPMLRALAAVDPMASLHDDLCAFLSSMRSDVIEPGLAAYALATDAEHRSSLVHILSNTGIRDERLFALFVSHMDTDLEMATCALAEYGDPRAIEHLARALDEYDVSRPGGPGDVLAHQVVIELRSAIEDLGGTLSVSQLAKCLRVVRAREQLLGTAERAP